MCTTMIDAAVYRKCSNILKNKQHFEEQDGVPCVPNSYRHQALDVETPRPSDEFHCKAIVDISTVFTTSSGGLHGLSVIQQSPVKG